QLTGAPADGYQVLAVRVTPATVRVKGSPEVLAKLKTVPAGPLRSPAPARTSSPRCPSTCRRGWRPPTGLNLRRRSASAPPQGRRRLPFRAKRRRPPAPPAACRAPARRGGGRRPPPPLAPGGRPPPPAAGGGAPGGRRPRGRRRSKADRPGRFQLRQDLGRPFDPNRRRRHPDGEHLIAV
ncbi:CdaR family protein, partial [Hydrogenibacillus schlegelii]|uniref:CdaR family protein n=1 Tax=Hydrogenibacillus schlegelii TaxID=1484 RepID=UPI0034A055AC